MKNTYEIPEVVELDQAHNLILGSKVQGDLDTRTGDEFSQILPPVTDIDE